MIDHSSLNKTIRRELEVAFSKHSQPIWFRIAKWTVIIGGMYLLYDNEYFSIYISLLMMAGIAIHLIWRYKTKGWTQSWIGWDYKRNKPNI